MRWLALNSLLLAALLWLSYNIVFRKASTLTVVDQDTGMSASLKFLTVAARAKQTATVIFVHGLGDTGYGWQPVATMFGSDPAFRHIKWVLPHAPEMPVTGNGGSRMPSWFDITSFDFEHAVEDEPGMLKTVRLLNEIITAEIDAGIPANRIVLGGFSQGGAMSLLAGLTSERKLAGVVVMSGWLPLRNKFKAMASDHATKLPIFWGHGRQDPLVKFRWAEGSATFLRNTLNVREATSDNPVGLEFHGYSGLVHSANDEELDDLQTWLKKVVPEQEQP